MHDILKLHKKGVDTTSPFLYPPVLVFNNFPTDDRPLELVVKTFQNMFPAINPEKVHIGHCRRVLLLQYDPVVCVRSLLSRLRRAFCYGTTRWCAPSRASAARWTRS